MSGFENFVNVTYEKFPALVDDELRVGCPFSCLSYRRGASQPELYMASIFWVVVHLNDVHKWPREEIADWLEATADLKGIDINFPTPETIPKEPGEK